MPFVRYAPKDDTFWIKDTKGGDVREIKRGRLSDALAKQIEDVEPAFVEVSDDQIMKAQASGFVFGPYTSFQDCVAKNSDKTNPQAFCAWLEHEITGKWPSELKTDLPQEAWSLYLAKYCESLSGSTKNHVEADKEAHSIGLQVLVDAGWDHSRGGWVKQFAAPAMQTVAGVKIFASGDWTDSSGVTRSWEGADLDKMVEAFRSGVPSIVPLKAGHTSDSFNTQIAEALGVPVDLIAGEMGQGQISLGRMSSLEHREGWLIASFDNVPDKIASLIEGGQFSTVSVEIEEEVGNFSPVLTGVALLGAELPAVDGASLDRALVFGGKREGARIFSFKAEEVSLDDLQSEFASLRDKFSEAIKGMKGVTVFRAMLNNLENIFKQMVAARKKGSFQDFHTLEERLRSLKWVGQDLGLKEGATIDEIIARIEQLKTATPGVDTEGLSPELQALLNESSKEKEMLNLTKGAKLSEFAEKFQLDTEELMAIAAALNLGEEATLEDIMNAIEAMKQQIAGPAEGQLQEFAKINTRMETLESENAGLKRDKVMAKFTKATEKLIGFEGTAVDLATELADIERDQGEPVAAKLLASYQKSSDIFMAAQKASGTSRIKTGEDPADSHPFQVKVLARAAEKNITYPVALVELKQEDPKGFNEYRMAVESD